MTKDLMILPQDLVIWSGMEKWKLDLANLVIKAQRENKWLKSKYQQITFTPIGLAKQLIQGRFVWGVINWDLIEPQKKADYN